MGEVTVVIGAGSIGQAIARRVSAGNHLCQFHGAERETYTALEVVAARVTGPFTPPEWCPSLVGTELELRRSPPAASSGRPV